MVSVNEQMNLDLKQAQLGLLNNQNRSTVEPSASHSNSSKITKQVVKPSPNRVTSNTNLTKPPKSSENKSSTLNGIKSKRVPLKVISFEDEDLDMDMTRAGFELYEAIRNQRFTEVMRLIEAGAHSYAKNGLHGGGPLHQLIINTAPVDSQSTRFRSRTAELLLTNGLDPNLQDLSGRTALMLAARKGQMDLLQLLISWPEIDYQLQDLDGNNAILHALIGRHSDAALQMLWILSKRPDRRLIRSSIEKMLRTRNKRGLNAFDLARLHGDQQLQLTFARYLTGHSWADLSHIRPYLPPTSMHPWLAHPSYYYPPAAPLVDPVVIPPPGPLAAAAPLGLPAASYYRYWNTLRPSRSLDSICSSLDVRQDDNLPTDLSPALLTATKYPLDPLLAAPVLGDPTLAAFQPLSSSTEELRRILQTQHADGAAAKSAAAAADAMLIDATLAAGPSGARNYARSLLWPELMATGRMAPWAGADTPYHRMWAQEAMHWFHGARARKQSLDALYAPAAERLTDLLIKGEDWPAQRDRKPAFGK